MTPATLAVLLKLIDLLAIGVQIAPQVLASYKAHRKTLDDAIDEGRELNQFEWENLLVDVQNLTDELNDSNN